MRPNRTRSVLVFALALAICPGIGHATIAVRDMWAPDGEVRAMAHGSNTIYLGGKFSRVGPVCGPAVALDLTTAAAQTPFLKVGGKVNAVEPDGGGGWYIGGVFNVVQGHQRTNLAHIDAAGQVTSWSPRTNGPVDDIAVSGGIVYAVGSFNLVSAAGGANEVQRWFAAAFTASTGVPTHWNPDTDAPPNEVEVGGGKVFIAGGFDYILFDTSLQPRTGLAEFTEVVHGNPSTGAPTGLFAGSDPSLINHEALELSNGKLLLGARYTYGNRARVYDVSVGSFLPYEVAVGGPVYDIALDQANGIFFIGGDFLAAGGYARTNLAAASLATGEVVTSWDLRADGPVRTLCMAPNGLLVGGDFSNLGFILPTTPRRGVALVDPLSPTVLVWDPALGGNVLAVEADGASGKAYVGGDFTIINCVPRTNLAAIDETTGAALSWNPSTNATVEALMVSGSTVYIGGQFSQVNATTRNRAAAVDGVTGALTSFNPNVGASDPTSTVKTFAISGTTVYIGGAFTSVRALERIGIAAVNASTGFPLSWDAFCNGSVSSITYVPGGIFGGPILVVGGDFTAIGGDFRNYVAILDPTTAAAGNTLDSPNGPVHSMFVEPLPPGYGGYNEIFLGGAFSSVGGQPRTNIASLAAFGLVTSWDPHAQAPVEAIAKVGSTVFVGGSFMWLGLPSQDRYGIAAIDPSGVVTPWDPHAANGYFSGVVYSLLESAGTIYAGGTFNTIANTPHGRFAGMSQMVTAVENHPAPAVTPMALRAAPNPFDHSTAIQFSLPTQGEATVHVYDVAGRRVREIHRGWLPAGRHTMSWDGREDSGRPVAAGVYFLGVKAEAGAAGSKIYRLR